MRNIRDVVRLRAGGMSKRQIAASLPVSSTSVLNCLRRAQAVGLGWPLPEDMTDEALEVRLYPTPVVVPEDRRPQPDWPVIHRELKRPGVTLQLAWQEHRAAHAQGYGYSRFCELCQRWKGRLSPVMRQTHVAGERLFVDYAGTTMDVFDATTGSSPRWVLRATPMPRRPGRRASPTGSARTHARSPFSVASARWWSPTI